MKAVRSVGNAPRSNRVPVIIPCHRIVSKHEPDGYSVAVGLKLELLRLESIDIKLLIRAVPLRAALH